MSDPTHDLTVCRSRDDAGGPRSASAPTSLKTRVLPWLAGAGMAFGHAAVASNCTVPQQGRCSSCGSCVLVVGSLVAWALSRQRGGKPFYEA